MKVGIIGYGSMGKMLLEKMSESKTVNDEDLYVANRTYEKTAHLVNKFNVCMTNKELAALVDIIFICVRPADIKRVLEEIKDVVRDDALLISLNGSVTFALMAEVLQHKTAKVIPSVTAEINQSQTLRRDLSRVLCVSENVFINNRTIAL